MMSDTVKPSHMVYAQLTVCLSVWNAVVMSYIVKYITQNRDRPITDQDQFRVPLPVLQQYSKPIDC